MLPVATPIHPGHRATDALTAGHGIPTCSDGLLSPRHVDRSFADALKVFLGSLCPTGPEAGQGDRGHGGPLAWHGSGPLHGDPKRRIWTRSVHRRSLQWSTSGRYVQPTARTPCRMRTWCDAFLRMGSTCSKRPAAARRDNRSDKKSFPCATLGRSSSQHTVLVSGGCDGASTPTHP